MRNQLILENLKFVYPIAKKLSGLASVPVKDLVSAGQLAVIEAIDNYDESKGSLETYVKIWINKRVREAIRETSEIVVADKENRKVVKYRQALNKLGANATNKELAKELGCSVDKVVELKSFCFETASMNNKISESDTFADTLSSSLPTPDQEYKELEKAEVVKEVFNLLTKEELDIMKSRYGISNSKVESTIAKRKAIMRKIRKNPRVMALLEENYKLF